MNLKDIKHKTYTVKGWEIDTIQCTDSALWETAIRDVEGPNPRHWIVVGRHNTPEEGDAAHEAALGTVTAAVALVG